MLQVVEQKVRRIASDKTAVHRLEVDVAQAIIDVIERVDFLAWVSDKIINIDRKVRYSGIIGITKFTASMRSLKLLDQAPVRESARLRSHAADYENMFAVAHLLIILAFWRARRLMSRRI